MRDSHPISGNDAAPTRIPAHVGVIMDGNGRWAQARGMPRTKGHEVGIDAIQTLLRSAVKFGIRYVSVYAFSVENWKRPKDEVSGLMSLLRSFLANHEDVLHENRTHLRVMGRRSDLPLLVDQALRRAERATERYTDHTLVLALSYGGRTEIARAARLLAEEVRAGTLAPDDIDEAAVARNLYLPDIPDPDLIIRTSGELRLSNFMLWQCAYSELYVTPVLWPDFGEDDFREALEAFSHRKRRFGGLTEESPKSEVHSPKSAETPRGPGLGTSDSGLGTPIVEGASC